MNNPELGKLDYTQYEIKYLHDLGNSTTIIGKNHFKNYQSKFWRIYELVYSHKKFKIYTNKEKVLSSDMFILYNISSLAT